MAHAVVEWTANLAGELDIRGLLARIAEEFGTRSDGVFPVGGIRVRAVRLDDYVIADGKDERDAFVNITVRMGKGRSAEFRQTFFNQLFTAVREFIGDLPDRRPFGLTMYVDESEGWKLNTIHDRLKGSAT